MTRDPWYFQRWAFETTTGNPVRKAVLGMLAMMADAQSGRGEAKQETLAQGVEASERAVRGHLKALEEAGIIARRAQFRRDRGRRGDEFLLLAPGIDEWPDGEPIQPAPGAGGPGTVGYPPSGTDHAGQELPPRNGHAQRQDGSAREEPADAFPEDLPEALHETAIAVGKLLKRTALTRGQKKEVTRAAVGHAILTFEDRPHLQVAREVEAWLLHGRGARKSCADVVARYRNFLANSDPAAGPPLPVGVAPLHGRRPSNADAVQANIERLQAARERYEAEGRILPS